MSQAVRDNGPASVPVIRENSGASMATSVAMRLDEVYVMAERFAEAKLFGANTPQQVFTLMMLAQAEGIHPALAMRQFHIMEIKGRTVVALRSDATQGKMIAAGWKITPIETNSTKASALFAHPTKQPNGFELTVTKEQYKHLASRDTWINHPDDMLWARLVCKACRRLDPGIIAGIYSTDEVDDMDAMASPVVVHARVQQEAIEAIRRSDIPIPGQPESDVDTRPYSAAATDAARVVGYQPADLHKHLMLRALATGHADGTNPRTIGEAIKKLTTVYGENRDWVRQEIAEFCQTRDAVAETPAEPATESAPAPSTLFPTEDATTARGAYGPGADG